ncbi:NUDIX hydrolase [Sedimentimonas flavescens]|uniref:NUDIX hydrolase n=1 Tax=Sedimentimonas flavescens TaxID=2851012 RepID=UPI001C49E858|nr:NUDIX hydrolase [Sedimentimonas flavescens]MBW0156576.1 NUDIX hydrolase [Sedimentimonas flavescens]
MSGIPRLGVLAVVLRGDSVLLVRRANPPDAGLWGFPGGKVDWGETVEAAALRELAEETGVSADQGQIIASADAISHDDSGAVAFHYHLVAVQCRYRAGEPVAADDALEAAWVEVGQVLARQLPMSRRVDEVLRRALGRG